MRPDHPGTNCNQRVGPLQAVMVGPIGAVIATLIAVLRDPAVQSSIDALSGYDLTRAGSVELLA
jgi:hypothetical protein